MRAAVVTYPQAITPEGGMHIERPSHGELSRAMSDSEAALTIQQIGYEAWRHSDWVQDIAEAHEISADTLTARAFDPSDGRKINRQIERVEASDRLGHRAVTYWFGEVLKAWPEGATWDTLPDNPWSYFAQGYSHGFVKMERQASSNRLLRAGQRAANLGIYACIHDLNVVPEKQGKGLGAALAYVGLADQPKDIKSSLYTAANNEPMRAWAEKYGYHIKDEYEDTELFDGVAVPFLHYAAKSVSSVLRRMVDVHPWLAKGEKTTMLGRVLDEAEAEMISRNPR